MRAGATGIYYHHDIEDVIAVVDGRPTLVSEIRRAPDEIREFLASRMRSFLEDAAFMEALPGHLQPDVASQGRAPEVRDLAALCRSLNRRTFGTSSSGVSRSCCTAPYARRRTSAR